MRILRGGAWPARDPEANLADLKAQIAACEAGISELRRAARDFGAAAARAYLRHVRINVARAAARLTARIAAGEGFAETDDGAAIRVKIRKDEKGRAIFDFRESSPRHPRNFNAPAAVVRAAVLYCLRALLNEDMPLNDGLLAPIRILLTPGSMLSPAPAGGGGGGQCRDLATCRRRGFRGLGRARRIARDLQQFHFRDRRAAVLRNRRRRHGRGRGLFRRGRGASAYDEFAASPMSRFWSARIGRGSIDSRFAKAAAGAGDGAAATA